MPGGISLDFYLIIDGISFLLALFLGIFILARGTKSKLINIFSLVTFSTAAWILTLSLFYNLENSGLVLFFGRLNFVTTELVALSVLFFAYFFPKKIFNINIYIRVFLILETITLSIITLLTPLIDKNELIEGTSRVTEYGPLYILFVIHFVFYLVVSFFIFIYKFWKLKRIFRLQIVYMSIGIVSALTLGGITNIAIPLFFSVFDTQKLGPFASLLFLSFTIYSILKYRLLNIKLVITRSLLYFFLIVVVTSSFVGGLFLTGKFFADKGVMGDFGAAAIVSLAVVFLFDPLKRYFARVTDWIFYKDKIDFQEVTREVTEVINREIELQDLADKVAGKLKDKMKLKEAFLLLSVGKGCFLRPQELEKVEARKRHHRKKRTVFCESSLIKYLDKIKDEVVTDELERMMLDEQSERKQKQLKKVFDDLQALEAAMSVPIFDRETGQMTAVLILGKKMSGDVFSNEEFKLLELISPQIASALQKSKLYQEVKSFNVKLQKEVEKATAEIKDVNMELSEYNEELSVKNKNLDTLQKFANDILHEIEFKTLTHKLINALPGEISYCRTALLTLLDDKGKNLHAVTIPQTTKLAQQIYNLLGGRDLSRYNLSLADSKNLLVKAVKTKKEQVSENLADFLSPPLPQEMAKKIEDLKPAMASAVAFPLIIGGQVIGVLHFSLTRKIEDISREDLTMLRAVADEVALAIERAQFFERLKKLNSQLKSANKNLKELDKAKSEFMSIASHQLRTPLTGIMGYLSMILEGDYGKMGAKQKHVIKEVFDASQRLIRLVNIFLNITRIEAGRFVLNYTEVDLDELAAKEVKELMPNATKKNLKLIYHGPKKKLNKIKVDADKIKDIVINLTDNAIKYTEKGKVDVFLSEENNLLKLMVQDTGVGIDPQEVKKLFQKFVRAGGGAKIDAGGSGLGLYIVKRIAEAHGGKVAVESDGVGKGSRFIVWLPYQTEIKK